MGLAEPLRVIVIAGVNLPMLLKALGNRRCPLEDLASMLIDSAKNGIVEVRQDPPEALVRRTTGESDGAA
jgi:mannose/fructose-specific phosphotransferase system component IIA